MRIITILIAHAIGEYFPTSGRCCAIAPWIDAERTIAAIEVAGIRVTLLITLAIAPLCCTIAPSTLFQLPFEIQLLRWSQAIGRFLARPSLIIWIEHLTCFTGPFFRAEAFEIGQFVFASSAPLARIRITFIVRVSFAVVPARAEWAFTAVAAIIQYMANALQARTGIAVIAGEFTIFTVESVPAQTVMARLFRGALTAVLTRRIGTEVNLHLAMTSHVAGLTIAIIVVHQLHAIQGAGC